MDISPNAIPKNPYFFSEVNLYALNDKYVSNNALILARNSKTASVIQKDLGMSVIMFSNTFSRTTMYCILKKLI